MASKYRVLTGMNYRPKGAKNEVRREPGEIIDDIPAKSIKWLLEQGHLEPVKDEGGTLQPGVTMVRGDEAEPMQDRLGD